ncbi:MAG: PEGA domain-containing protein [Myxococcota bacterium]
MIGRLASRTLGVVFVGVILSVSGAATAQTDAERAQARASFQSGVESYEGGRYQVALEAFQEAYRIAPHPSVRVNMANCYEQLGRPVEAIFHFERFLVEAENVSDDQNREVRSALTRLRRQVGEVFFRVTPEGANVTIDNSDTRRAPILDAVRLPVGVHQVVVAHDGYQTVRREVNVASGARTEVRVSLVVGEVAPGEPTENPDPVTDPVAPDPAQTAAEAPVEEGPRRNYLNTPALIAGGATIAVGLTALALGVSAIRQNSDFDDAVADSNDPSLSAAEQAAARRRGVDAKDKADRRALTADILGFTALAGAGVTAYFLFFYDDGSSDRASAESQVRAAPALGPGGAGLVLEGTF